MRYIRKISDYAIAGGIGALVIAGLNGCGSEQGNNQAFTQASQTQGAFVVIEEMANGGYQIADEYPSAKTTVVLRDTQGNERILSEAELQKFIAEENAKIDAGTSALTDPSMSSGAPGLGQILLSSMAGAMLGAWIGNKLFGNQNYQNQRQAGYKNPQTYSRSVDSFNKRGATAGAGGASRQGGFFNNQAGGSTSQSGSVNGG